MKDADSGTGGRYVGRQPSLVPLFYERGMDDLGLDAVEV